MRFALFVALAALVTGYAFWVYARRELAVRSARGLAVLRSLALVVLLALLFNPRIPGGSSLQGPERWVLLDASRSMEGAWEEARGQARALEEDGWRVVSFGDGVVGLDAGAASLPEEGRSLLAPALERAAEAGVREVTVVSDLRFEDAVQVQGALDALPLRVSFRPISPTGVDAGVGSFVVPDAPRPAEARTASVEVFGFGVDSLDVEIREEGRLVASRRLAVPSPGLRLPVRMELPPPQGEGRLRYTASVTVSGDGFADDDEAVDYATVGHEEGALVLVSFRPDWEPRYLLPVLGQVTGLPPRGYLRVGADRYMPMGRAVDRAEPVDSASVRAAVNDAALLVLHGVEGRLQPWERSLVERAGGRTLVFPVDAGGAGILDVGALAPRPGEWYASQDLPPSGLAADLAGVRLQGLPPLAGIMPLTGSQGGEVPLEAQLAGTGAPQSVLLLRRGQRGRQAVALASGFWRWGARDGDGRVAYRALWSGVAGWLLRSDGAGPVPDPRPTRWVFGGGEPVSFQLPGDTAETRRIQVRQGDAPVVDTTVSAGAAHVLPRLGPGLYAYTVLSETGDAVGEGRFDVSPRSDEMLPARFAASPPEGGTVGDGGVEEGRGRPLRTLPWPYVLVLLLLCGEWVARRRAGLR